ncbi:multiple C2 and transmembrane domain-containing protein isoform X2 [Hyalella azteca]|uniref:Multiple C2 and transmembrane domain-containing protein isoform X2 n=1 Tax=Hyalella azteca TaxID=294128 RepID=A0A979FGZ4_HYAAZ|nr:multiple C2 and transmembrane domain-containing protein isoform X2 [Hyalella azteca]
MESPMASACASSLESCFFQPGSSPWISYRQKRNILADEGFKGSTQSLEEYSVNQSFSSFASSKSQLNRQIALSNDNSLESHEGVPGTWNKNNREAETFSRNFSESSSHRKRSSDGEMPRFLIEPSVNEDDLRCHGSWDQSLNNEKRSGSERNLTNSLSLPVDALSFSVRERRFSDNDTEYVRSESELKKKQSSLMDLSNKLKNLTLSFRKTEPACKSIGKSASAHDLDRLRQNSHESWTDQRESDGSEGKSSALVKHKISLMKNTRPSNFTPSRPARCKTLPASKAGQKKLPLSSGNPPENQRRSSITIDPSSKTASSDFSTDSETFYARRHEHPDTTSLASFISVDQKPKSRSFLATKTSKNRSHSYDVTNESRSRSNSFAASPDLSGLGSVGLAAVAAGAAASALACNNNSSIDLEESNNNNSNESSTVEDSGIVPLATKRSRLIGSFFKRDPPAPANSQALVVAAKDNTSLASLGSFRRRKPFTISKYLQRGSSKLAEQQRRLKNQLWSAVVNIILVEGRDLLPMDPDGFSDPYAKFRLGNEKFKSKADARTLNPKWLEQFDFHLYDDQTHILEVTVWDKDARSKDDFMGKSILDLNEFEREKTHDIWTDLLDGAGKVHLLLTISGLTTDNCASDIAMHRDNPDDIREILDRYKWSRSLQNLKDVGHLTVKIYRAQGLASADIGGKSDPFCVVELINDRVQTHTEYKTLTPTWNKVFVMNVRDIHSVLEVTVYDEDRDHKVEFLGKVMVPLLRIHNGEKKWYALKDKKMRARAKGHYPEILMELSVHWNLLRAAVRTFTPRDYKYMQKDLKFNRQIFIRNVNRLKGTINQMVEGGVIINQIFTWQNPLQSSMAFVGFLLGVYFFEMYMIPLALLGIFFKNYVVISLVGSLMHKDDELETSSDIEDDDDDEKDKEEKKSLKERLTAIQEVTATVQNAIGFIASTQESIKNTFNFSVPLLSWMMVFALMCVALVLYYVPLRALVFVVGVNKFLKNLLRPNAINNNELVDFLSRVPDDENLRDYREIRLSPTMMEERRREMRKRKHN